MRASLKDSFGSTTFFCKLSFFAKDFRQTKRFSILWTSSPEFNIKIFRILVRFSFHCIVINLTIWARCRETLGTLKYETHLFVLRLQFLFQVAVRRPPGIAGIVYLLLITCLWSLRQFMSLSLRIPIICRGKLLLQCRNFLFRQCRPLQSNQTAN